MGSGWDVPGSPRDEASARTRVYSADWLNHDAVELDGVTEMLGIELTASTEYDWPFLQAKRRGGVSARFPNFFGPGRVSCGLTGSPLRWRGRRSRGPWRRARCRIQHSCPRKG